MIAHASRYHGPLGDGISLFFVLFFLHDWNNNTLCQCNKTQKGMKLFGGVVLYLVDACPMKN